jgi:ribosomal protein S18 acetylase RimI-like enzyme
MVSIRPAVVQDLLQMQQCNLFNLPENYNMRYWMYHLMTWTHLPHVAVDEHTGKIVGYVLAKMEEETKDKEYVPHGHITSLSVLRDYRKLGIATKLMRAAHTNMVDIYGAKFCSLHVR